MSMKTGTCVLSGNCRRVLLSRKFGFLLAMALLCYSVWTLSTVSLRILSGVGPNLRSKSGSLLVFTLKAKWFPDIMLSAEVVTVDIVGRWASGPAMVAFNCKPGVYLVVNARQEHMHSVRSEELATYRWLHLRLSTVRINFSNLLGLLIGRSVMFATTRIYYFLPVRCLIASYSVLKFNLRELTLSYLDLARALLLKVRFRAIVGTFCRHVVPVLASVLASPGPTFIRCRVVVVDLIIGRLEITLFVGCCFNLAYRMLKLLESLSICL